MVESFVNGKDGGDSLNPMIDMNPDSGCCPQVSKGNLFYTDVRSLEKYSTYPSFIDFDMGTFIFNLIVLV